MRNILSFFTLLVLLRLCCAALLWSTFNNIDLMAFFIAYLSAFFCDAADGPGALLMPEQSRQSKVEALFFEISEQIFMLSFFSIMALRVPSPTLFAGCYTLALYYAVGWLSMLSSNPLSHLISSSHECLYDNMTKKILRLTLKASPLMLIIGQLTEGMNPSFLESYTFWTQAFGPFEQQGVILLSVALFCCYALLIHSAFWAPQEKIELGLKHE